LGSAAAPSVRARALPADRKAAAMPRATVRADLGHALDVGRDLAPQVALDEDFLRGRHPVDDLAEASDLLLAEVLGSRVRVDARALDHLLGGRVADARDVRESDDRPLLRWDVDAGDSRHVFLAF